MAAKPKPSIGREEDAPGRVRVRGPLSQKQLARLFGCDRANIYEMEMKALRKIYAAAWGDPELAGMVLEAIRKNPRQSCS